MVHPRRSTILALLLVAPSAWAGPVVIDELLADPVGVDVGHEWIELLHVGEGDVDEPAVVDLTGWSLERETGAGWVAVHTFGPLDIASGAHLVVGEDQVPEASVVLAPGTLGLGDGATSGDGLRLVDALGTIVDTVIYGVDNSRGLVDDSGAVAVSWAPAPGEGDALGRVPDGVDTDASGDDFAIVTATPGFANPAPAAGLLDTADADDTGAPSDTGLVDTADTDAPPGNGRDSGSAGPPSGVDTALGLRRGVIVNELLAVSSAGPDAAWIELATSGDAAVDLSGWQVEVATAGTWQAAYVVPVGTLLDPAGYLLIGGPAASADLVSALPLGLGDGLGAADGVRLVDPAGRIVDTVVYGGANLDGLFDDGAAPATSIAPRPPADTALARAPDRLDTDRCGDDLVLSLPSPGVPNDLPRDSSAADTGLADTGETGSPAPTTPVDTAPPARRHVVINEVLPLPSVDGTAWIEILNLGDEAEPLDGWTVEIGVGGGWQPAASLSDVLVPGAYVVLGEESSGGDLVLPSGVRLGLGSGSVTGAAVRLVDATGRVRDTLIYGVDNNAGYVDDSGVVGTSLGPVPGVDASLARLPDGVDTDASGADLGEDLDPTPGLPNDGTVGGGGGTGTGATAGSGTGTSGGTGVGTAPGGGTGGSDTGGEVTGDGETGAPTSPGGTDVPGTDTGPGRAPPGAGGDTDDGSKGRSSCGCATSGTGPTPLVLPMLLLLLRRRRGR